MTSAGLTKSKIRKREPGPWALGIRGLGMPDRGTEFESMQTNPISEIKMDGTQVRLRCFQRTIYTKEIYKKERGSLANSFNWLCTCKAWTPSIKDFNDRVPPAV